MILSRDQHRFLEQRRRFVTSWRYAGPCLLALIAGLTIYLAVTTPLLVNPYEVVAVLKAGTIEQSSLETMAVLLPMMSIAVCFLLVVLVVVMSAAFANERKYLEIVAGFAASDEARSEGAPACPRQQAP